MSTNTDQLRVRVENLEKFMNGVTISLMDEVKTRQNEVRDLQVRVQFLEALILNERKPGPKKPWWKRWTWLGSSDIKL